MNDAIKSFGISAAEIEARHVRCHKCGTMRQTHPIPECSGFEATTLRNVAEAIAYEHAAAMDAEFGCCHDEEHLRLGGRPAAWEDEDFDPLPDFCVGKKVLDRHLAALDLAEESTR